MIIHHPALRPLRLYFLVSCIAVILYRSSQYTIVYSYYNTHIHHHSRTSSLSHTFYPSHPPTLPHSQPTEYILRLSEDNSVTADSQVPPLEAERRRLLLDLRFKVILNVNGKPITQSDISHVQHPSLLANFNQYFELRLLHEPSEVSFDVYTVRTGRVVVLCSYLLYPYP